ncbi:MAG: pilus assembly protein TadG-related protein [Planctomycetaceae bacterium]
MMWRCQQFRPPESQTPEAARRGSVLPLFAVLLFALLPLMALIIHTGLVTLTRRQMQTAVNTAAIEGLRFRDDASLTETERREWVRELVSAVFDDNLNSDAGDAMQFGAGPVLDIDGGVELGDSDFRALTKVSVPTERAYKPDLQLNETDQPHGDMLRGNNVFDSDDPNHDSHQESPDYSREDFEPQPGGDAFLVRLRRTRSPDGTAPSLDDVPGISSTGPTVPFLFGRGPYGGREFLNRRERGTIVRATAICRIRPVLTAGWYNMAIDGGVGPIVLTYSEWVGATQPIPVTNAHFVDTTGPPLSVGTDRPAAGTPVNLSGDSRYVAIVDDDSSRVIGFGSGVLQFDTMAGTGTVTRGASTTAARNASALLLSPVSGLSEADWDAVFAAHRRFDADSTSYEPQSEPLLAPAAMRSMN